MAGIYDDDPTDPAQAKRTRSRGGDAPGRRRVLGLGGSAAASIGALVVTFAVSYVLALALLWLAGKFISIGASFGGSAAWVVAALLTGSFYWYDRNNP